MDHMLKRMKALIEYMGEWREAILHTTLHLARAVRSQEYVHLFEQRDRRQ